MKKEQKNSFLKNKYIIILLLSLFSLYLFFQVSTSKCSWVYIKQSFPQEKLLTSSKKCIPIFDKILNGKHYDVIGYGSESGFLGDGDWEYFVKIPENEIPVIEKFLLKSGAKLISFYPELKEECISTLDDSQFNKNFSCNDDTIYELFIDLDKDDSMNNYIEIFFNNKKGLLFIKKHFS